MTAERSEDFIDIYDLLAHLWGKRRWIIAGVVLGAIGGALYGVFGAPQYESRAIVSSNAPRSPLSDLMGAFPVGGGGATLLEARLTSRSISERVAILEPGVATKVFGERWDEKNEQWKRGSIPTPIATGARLRKKHLEVASNVRQGIVSIKVVLPDSVMAKRAADAYLKALKASIQENLHKELQETREFLEEQARHTTDPQILQIIQEMLARNIQRGTFNNPSDFQIVEYPAYPIAESGPRPVKSAVLYGVLGAVGAVLVFAARYMLFTAFAERRKRKQMLSKLPC